VGGGEEVNLTPPIDNEEKLDKENRPKVNPGDMSYIGPLNLKKWNLS
jgi:hypothetical protein